MDLPNEITLNETKSWLFEKINKIESFTLTYEEKLRDLNYQSQR